MYAAKGTTNQTTTHNQKSIQVLKQWYVRRITVFAVQDHFSSEKYAKYNDMYIQPQPVCISLDDDIYELVNGD